MELLLLGLVGVTLLGALISDSSEDDVASEDAEPDTPDPVVVGQELFFDGSLLLEGTEGDDTISGGQGSDLLPEDIRLLGGDDVAFLDEHIGVGVFGGEGDDTLTSIEYGTPLYGGEGDDVLAGVNANPMYGDAGNDQITLDMNAQPGPDSFGIDGGEGNDTISIHADVGMDAPDRSGAGIKGGEGKDSFELFLNLENSDGDLDDSGGALLTTLGRIEDFDPSEDSLVVQIDSDEDAAERELVTSMTQVEDEGKFVSTVRFGFKEHEDIPDAAAAVAILWVESDVPFGLDDIVVTRV